jgi:ATPase subunit of ABC transporter with duplicated ATPase domains
MMQRANVLILDEPTNHLDLESITALNEGLAQFKGTVLFTSQDREFVNTIAARIIEITPKGLLDKSMTYDEYLETPSVAAEREALY